MTPLQMEVLKYLSDKMEANSMAIGNALFRNKNMAAMNANQLVVLGYAIRIPELKAWRITAEGRKRLSALTGNTND